MKNTEPNSIRDEEETLATPRFVAPPAAAAPQRVVSLERIRGRTASAVKRVRYRMRPAERESAASWLPYFALVIVAGVAVGFFLATNRNSATTEDAPVVRSELEAKPKNSNAETKKAAFVERESAPSNLAESKTADSETSDSESTNDAPDSGDKLLSVEDEPKISTEIEVRNTEKAASKQSAPRAEDERLELIRKDAERQAAREREERQRRERADDKSRSDKAEEAAQPGSRQKPGGEYDENFTKPERF